METFEQFLTSRWRDRLSRYRALCVYDAGGRYRDLALSLGDAETRVIDTGSDIITARSEAFEAWRKLAEDATHRKSLLIYLPRTRPLDAENQLEDPFTPLVLGGAAFPDGAGDEYRALCEQFLPEQKSALDDLFAQGEPSIGIVNGLVAGREAWPALADCFKTEGAKDLLIKFLCLAPAAKKKLKAAPHWSKELKALASKTLGLTLQGGAGDIDDLRSQLWRYLLFSEFAADLPTGIPTALASVPRASEGHERFALELCSTLRDLSSAQSFYEEFAQKTANELHLEQHCQGIDDLGRLDTFAFEERSFLRLFAKELLAERFEPAQRLLNERSQSFWIRDPERAAQWKLAACCLDLRIRVSDCRAAIRDRGTRSVVEWIDFYITEFWRADALHRELEQVAQETNSDASPLDEVLEKTRDEYRQLADRLTRAFQGAVAHDGWPASGIPRAGETFERSIRQTWQEGKRVAYFWIDAFRYDLAQLLAGFLSRTHEVSVIPVCAQLPTVTRIGMAALLPEADKEMKLGVDRNEVIPQIKAQPILTVSDRFKLLQEFVGKDRTRLFDLEDLAAPTFKEDLAAVEVLVVKTSDIDLQGENNPAHFIRILRAVVRSIELAVNRLANLGFEVAVIATDHGFWWFHDATVGSSVKKPAGDWIQVKERSLLGSGQSSDDVLLLDANHVGIRGDISHYAAAKGLATFSKGVRYFHDGLSPQECVLPVMQITLRSSSTQPAAVPVRLVMTYRGASSGKVTTLRPSVEISYPAGELFNPADVRFLLEGIDRSGRRVAEASAGPAVSAGTNEVSITQGQALKVAIRMDEEFEGEFELRAVNRETSEVYARLKIVTDFHH